jgi:predicted transcriptional regulator
MTDDDRARAFDFDNSGPFGNGRRMDRLRAAFAAIREECAKVAEKYCNDHAAHPRGCDIAHAIRTAQPAKASQIQQGLAELDAGQGVSFEDVFGEAQEGA